MKVYASLSVEAFIQTLVWQEITNPARGLTFPVTFAQADSGSYSSSTLREIPYTRERLATLGISKIYSGIYLFRLVPLSYTVLFLSKNLVSGFRYRTDGAR